MPTYDETGPLYAQALHDFHQARRKASLEKILSPLIGKQSDLLSYEEVRSKLRAIETSRRQLEEIPLNQIVGSVSRYTDFTRSFLPRQPSDQERWMRVRMGMESQMGLPPIEAYKVGDAYFVLDGHHRVSVARELGAETIEGYVIPVYSRVPISPGDSPDDVILKAEYTDFLAKTGIDELRPDANLIVTAPGQYQKLLEHISVHRYFMGVERKAPVPYEEAVVDWYDTFYLPIVKIIRERDLLRDFPDRTETDLYLWIIDHRAELGGGEIGWEVSPEKAAYDLSERYSQRAQRLFPRLTRRLAKIFVPQALTSGPEPGTWRAVRQSPRRPDHLFDDLLVAIPHDHSGWQAVRMAIELARREDARLTGLHVIDDESKQESDEVQIIDEKFHALCEEAGVRCRLQIDVSRDVANAICRRSPWVDLTVFRLRHPPPLKPIVRLRSGARMLIRSCSSPLLAVPDNPFHLESALLSYGPGRKSDEALFLATYLAGKWKIPLTVVTVEKEKQNSQGEKASLHQRARSYLESHGVEAAYVQEKHDKALSILVNAESYNAGLLIMGGYEASPVRESLLGSTVDRVLRSTRRPVLICR